MAKNRINACWLLLLALLFTASLVLSVGQSEARYNNTVVTRTLVNAQDAGVTSNCLVTNRDPAVTVLAGELNLYSSTNVSFWLHSSGSNAVGTLRWGVVNSKGEMDKELAQYVRVTMQSGADMVRQETDLELLEDVPMELTMIITPTETARNTAHKAMKINVAVTWGDSLWGNFQVILPEVEEEEDPETATEPEETQSEETQPEETQPEETQPEETQSEETQPEETQGEETQPVETQPETESEQPQPIAEPEETQPEETVSVTEPEETQSETVPQTTEPTEEEDPQFEDEQNNSILSAIASLLGIGEDGSTDSTEQEQENTQASTEPTGETVPQTTTEPTGETVPQTTTEPTEETVPENTTEPTEETVPENTTEPTQETTPEEPTQPQEPEEEKDPIRLETLGKFDSNGMLPVRLVMTDNVTSIRLGLGRSYTDDREDPEGTPLDVLPLPYHTRFSLDGGKSYYMLGSSSVAEFTVEDIRELEVLLDFRYTGMTDGTGFRLVMDAYEGENLAANCTQTTICSAPSASVKAVVYDRAEYEARPTAEQLEESGAEPVKLTGEKDSWVLNQHTVLELTLPNEWQEAELVYNIELLTVEEDGSLAYKRIDPAASGLVVTHNDNEREHNLVLTIGDRLPQAGTYRINMEWTYGNICYIRKQTTFFINYAADAGYLLGGLEVPKND